MRDVHYAFRTLARTPGFTAIAAATLALASELPRGAISGMRWIRAECRKGGRAIFLRITGSQDCLDNDRNRFLPTTELRIGFYLCRQHGPAIGMPIHDVLTHDGASALHPPSTVAQIRPYGPTDRWRRGKETQSMAALPQSLLQLGFAKVVANQLLTLHGMSPYEHKIVLFRIPIQLLFAQWHHDLIGQQYE